MYAIREIQNTAEQVSSWTQPVRSDSNLFGFFIGDVSMKTCTQCYTNKSLAEYAKDKRSKDNHRSICIKCITQYNINYRRTPKGLIIIHKSQQKYARSEKGRATAKLLRIKHGAKIRIRSKIGYLVKIGKIPKASDCVCECGQQAQGYHHHNGYGPEHIFDVIPLCRKCHEIHEHT